MPPFLVTLRILIPFALLPFFTQMSWAMTPLLAPLIQQDLNFSPQQLGFFMALYTIAFVLAQFPFALLLDRYGPKPVIAGALALSGLGALLHGGGQELWLLIGGRFLLGFGMSACFIGTLQAFALAFPAQKLVLFNALALAMLGVGNSTGIKLGQWFIAELGWRGIYEYLGLGALLLAGILVVIAPKIPLPKRHTRTLAHEIGVIGDVFRSKLFWGVAPVSIATQATGISFILLWAGPWLIESTGQNAMEIGDYLFAASLALTAGLLFFGIAGEKLRRLNIISLRGLMFIASALFLIPQIFIILGALDHIFILMIAFGFLNTAGMLSFAILLPRFEPSVLARVATCLNICYFAGGFLFQGLTGMIVNLFGTQDASGMVGYTAQGFQIAFGLLVLFQVAALAWCVRHQKELDSTTP